MKVDSRLKNVDVWSAPKATWQCALVVWAECAPCEWYKEKKRVGFRLYAFTTKHLNPCLRNQGRNQGMKEACLYYLNMVSEGSLEDYQEAITLRISG